MAYLRSGLNLCWALCLVTQPCRAEYAKWGAENWSCGITKLPGTLGTGSDIWLKSIDGNASGGFSGSHPKNGMYQKLIVILSEAPEAQGAVPVPAPPSSNNEIDGNLYGMILKQNGPGAPNLPDTSRSIRRSKYRMASSLYFDGGPAKANVPCLDAEVQLTFQWQTTTP